MIRGTLIWARRWKRDDNGLRALDLKLGKLLVARIWTDPRHPGFFVHFPGHQSHKGYRTERLARSAAHRYLGLFDL